MRRLLISLLVCAFVLGHVVSSQAAIFEFEYDPVMDIFVPPTPPPDNEIFLDPFNVNGKVKANTITSATISVFFNNYDDVMWKSAGVIQHPDSMPVNAIDYALWQKGNHVSTLVDNADIIADLQSDGFLQLSVINVILPPQPPFFPGSGGEFFFDKAVLTIEASAIPIPGAIWLLGSGLAGLVVVRQRKK